MTVSRTTDVDVLLLGGGLSAGLIALALKRQRPDLRVALVEAGATFGGNHTWSSFGSDLSEEGRALVAPLIAHRWDEYEVRFPGYRRRLANGYQSATSERLDAALREAVPEALRFMGVSAVDVTPDRVLLSDQRALTAGAVIDARGQRTSPHLDLGFQKFVGLEVEFEAPHGLTGPIIMDATIDQTDGYRFVYTLPFSPTTALIEDTYYADGPALDRDAVAARVRAYAEAQGWRIKRLIRDEDGVLPIAIGGDIAAHLAGYPAGVAPVGMAAALFHPVTGYSFPDAVRLALMVAALPDLSGAAIDAAVRAHAAELWNSRGFYRLLNKMLFRGAFPDERRQILERFYKLPDGLVSRFYAGHSSLADMARVLTGKPPIPIGRAIRAIMKG
ncbi:lycopene beta-cyclase CrtY [Sandaracinobacter neustonicus]|uniref:Lycopene beta-cyclase CrtY n=1 Tax=Sandaracinobacter neustonicus TaxID=1715348 RepID=A0A501XTA2_9SPHN|nr:lycopene beta-cyclase CrtY [Sandaracinobacter neustonicus]TPE63603.1 lycopene beta-cyclase CrtY [Sandaracinobacter neustonicus]